MLKKAHILICDDERGIRESLKLILAEEYLLSYVSNGQEALEAVKRIDPDLLIMDIKMPRLSGLDALPKIKRAKRQLKVLIITGYESSDVAVEAVNKGADDYLTKPFEREKIRAKIDALLAQKG